MLKTQHVSRESAWEMLAQGQTHTEAWAQSSPCFCHYFCHTFTFQQELIAQSELFIPHFTAFVTLFKGAVLCSEKSDVFVFK